MSPQFQTAPSSIQTGNAWRVSGLDFDQEGGKSTLDELLQLEGVVLLAEVADRLPFDEDELMEFATGGVFTSCFEQVQAGRARTTSDFLVNVSLFAKRFEELIQPATREDLKDYFSSTPDTEALLDLEEFA